MAALGACRLPGKPPDVVLIVVDTLRADHLGLYGYEHPTSPALDALGERSVVFERAYSTAPWTLPSVASMLTGHQPYALGIRKTGAEVPEQVTTLGELYKAAGYSTAAVVSHIYLQEQYGLLQGIDTIDDAEVEGHHTRITSKGVTSRALDIVDAHARGDGDRPLFLLVHYFDPHYEYYLHPEVYDTYPEYDGPLRSGVPIKEMQQIVQEAEGRPEALRSLANIYDSEIRFTDLHIGQLLVGIEATGRADDTLIVVVGDHGEELGDRPSRWIGHTRVVTDDVMHVPLIMKLPHGARPRARIAEPVSFIDLMPTIAALSGLSLSDDLGIPGEAWDLADSSRYRPTLFAESGRWTSVQMARTARWKLVHHRGLARSRVELFDMATDPGETTDVIASHPGLATSLGAELAQWNAALEVERARLLPSETEPALSKEQEEALRAMGYVE